jgi:hypothetical protein
MAAFDKVLGPRHRAPWTSWCSPGGCRWSSSRATSRPSTRGSWRLEETLVWPYQRVVIRAFRALAWTALALGTVLVLLIIDTMVFAHR